MSCTLMTAFSVGLPNELESIVQEIKASGPRITNEGNISHSLGDNTTKVGNEYHLTQPQLIQSILDKLHLDQSSTTKDTPMKSSKLLSRHPNSDPFDGHFNC
jgi:hypothetical protein